MSSGSIGEWQRMSSSLTNETEMGPGSIFAKESTVREEGKGRVDWVTVEDQILMQCD